MKNPLLVLIIIFLTGILSAEKLTLFGSEGTILLNISFLLFLLILLIVLRKKGKFFYITLCIFFFFLGTFRCGSVINPPQNDISRFISDSSSDGLVYGTVITEAEWKSGFYNRHAAFILQVERLFLKEKEYFVTGKIYVNFSRSHGIPLIGERIAIGGKIALPADKKASVGFSRRKYLSYMGVRAIMFSREKDFYIKLDVPKNPLILARRFLSNLRNISGYIINRYISGDAESITESLVIGQRCKISSEINDIFIKTGTMHILSVSGLHVGIVAITVMCGLKLVRCPKGLMYLSTVLIIFAYSIFTGASSPAVRAALMGVFMIFSMSFDRRLDITSSIFLSAFLITFFQPGQLFRPSFILSYLAVLSIVYVAPVVEASFGVKNFVVKSMTVSFGVWMGMAPVIASYFSIITPSVILANILAIPVSFLIILFGFGLLFVGAMEFLLPLTNIISATLILTISFFIKSMEIISKIPFASIVISPPGVVAVVIFYTTLICIIILNKTRKRPIPLSILVLLTINLFVWNEILNLVKY